MPIFTPTFTEKSSVVSKEQVINTLSHHHYRSPRNGIRRHHNLRIIGEALRRGSTMTRDDARRIDRFLREITEAFK